MVWNQPVLGDASGPATCIPFTTVSAHPPSGEQGDFYVDEFTDTKLRERWVACKADKVCYDRVYKQVIARHPPNKEYKLQDAHGRFLLGKIEEKGAETDLTTIRRPGYFARAPYNEALVACLRTHVSPPWRGPTLLPMPLVVMLGAKGAQVGHVQG